MQLYRLLIKKLYKGRKFYDFLVFILLVLGFFNVVFYRYVTLPKRSNILLIFILLCYLAIGLQVVNQLLGLQYPEFTFIYYSFIYLISFYYILGKLLVYTNLLKRVADDHKINLHELFGNPFSTFYALMSKVVPKANKIAVGAGIGAYTTAKAGYFYDGQLLIPHVQNLEACNPQVRQLIIESRHSLLDSYVNWYNPSFHTNPGKVTLQEFFVILEQVDQECIAKTGVGTASYSDYVSLVGNKVKHAHIKC
jgi:hypothetical protein